MDLKEKAVALRQQGLTYKEISNELDGAVSIDWCKRNLKQIRTPVVEDECVNAVIEKAIRPEGVSVYEANGIIMEHNKALTMTKSQMRTIREKAKMKNPECLFRQEWMSTKDPVKSHKAFCAYVLHMQDEIDNIVRWYCDTFPETKPSSVKYELLEYLKPSKDSISLGNRISKAENLCEVMQERITTAP